MQRAYETHACTGIGQKCFVFLVKHMGPTAIIQNFIAPHITLTGAMLHVDSLCINVLKFLKQNLDMIITKLG